jgi:hypothetical protein
MKTAVEILVEQLIPKAFATYDVTTFNAIEQSKQIEKEQIIQAHIDGFDHIVVDFKKQEYAEQYYNQTYNQNES